MEAETDKETAKRRLAFQKSYSQEVIIKIGVVRLFAKSCNFPMIILNVRKCLILPSMKSIP